MSPSKLKKKRIESGVKYTGKNSLRSFSVRLRFRDMKKFDVFVYRDELVEKLKAVEIVISDMGLKKRGGGGRPKGSRNKKRGGRPKGSKNKPKVTPEGS